MLIIVLRNLHSFFCFVLFCFRAAPRAYGSSQSIKAESELQVQAYATATAMPDLSHICNLHHSSRQHQILNPLSKATDRTRNLMVPSWIRFCCATMGTRDDVFYLQRILACCARRCSRPFTRVRAFKPVTAL